MACLHYTYIAYPVCLLHGCLCPEQGPQCLSYEPRVAFPKSKPEFVLRVENGNFWETHDLTKPNEISRAPRGWPKRCKCGTMFVPGSNRQVLCDQCSASWRRSKQREYLKHFQERKRND